jgi:putative oxidoreductase
MPDRIKKFFSLSFLPLLPDLGLLIFRIALPFLMIRYHGWGKLAGWKDESIRLPNFLSLDGAIKESHTFPDYIGISSELSYVLVTWLETFGSIAIMFGLFTRFQSAGLFIAMMVAFFFHHEANFNGGETAFSFGFCYLLLFLTGPGKYSLDHKLRIGRT